MLKLRKIAVTGGISSGKTSACRFLEDLGCYVVYADEITHQLLSPKTGLGQKVIKLLGPEIVIHDQIDRAKIADKVFTNPHLLHELEALMHPAVYQEIQNQYQRVKENDSYPLFVAEVPLLFESKGESWFDATIAIVAKGQTASMRFEHATGNERDEYDRRMARQMIPYEKAQKADYIINNDGNLDEFKQNVSKLFNQLTSK